MLGCARVGPEMRGFCSHACNELRDWAKTFSVNSKETSIDKQWTLGFEFRISHFEFLFFGL